MDTSTTAGPSLTPWLLGTAPNTSAADAATSEQLNALLATLAGDLGQRAGDASFAALLAEVFGAAGTAPAAFEQASLELIGRLQSGDGLGLRFVTADAAAMGGARAAYAASGSDGLPTVYLNADWLAEASADDLRLVLLEEIGHHLDQLLNGTLDSSGDEGELFAALYAGTALTAEQRAAIAADQDAGRITIDGQPISVEFDSVSSINSVTFSNDTGASNSDRITTGGAQTVTVITTNNTSNPNQPTLFYSINGGARTAANIGTWADNNTTTTWSFSAVFSGSGSIQFYTAVSGGSALNLTGTTTNSFSYTIDATAPAPVFTSAASTSDTTPVISGTSEAGSTITLTIAGATYTTTATGGVWSVDVGSATPSSGSLGAISVNNSYTVNLTATDAAGNTGSASQTLSVVEPILKTVTINSLSVDSGLSTTDFITNDSNGLTISATLSAALGPGETLQYSNNNGSSWTDVTSSVSGTAVTVVDANLTASATIQFRITNTTTGALSEAASQLVTIDTTAPTIPANDLKNTLTLDAASTSLQPVVVLGWLANSSAQAPTLTEGDVIEIFDNATNAVLGRHLITAGNLTGGQWNANTATVALTGLSGDGTYNLKVRIADRAGNVAAASVSTNTFALVIDTTAPATPVLALGTGVADGATTTEATQASGVVTVTAEFGSTVAVTFSNGTSSVTKSVTIPGSGSNTRGVTLTSADLVTLGDGVISVSATATDSSGNTSSAGTTTFLLNPSITVNAVVVDPDNLPAAGAEIASFSTNIDLNTVDVVPVDPTLFTVDEAAGKVYLTQAGAEKLAADKGLFTVDLKLVAGTNPALKYDEETDYLGGLQTVTPSVDIGAGFPAYLSFAAFWIGTATDKDGDPLSATNPNQFNYFKATSQISGGGWFVADLSGNNSVGNNTYGTIHYRDGNGALVTIQGTLSRVYKQNGNDIQAIYFYPGTDFPEPSSPGANLDLYMLDLYGSTRPDFDRFTITAGTVYKTSSDTLDEFFYPVTVNSVTVNEASPWAVFKITSVENLELSLSLGNTSDPSDNDATPAGFSLQYSADGGTTWIDYTWDGSSGNRPTIQAGGTILVRVDITSESDDDYEGGETFTLVVAPEGGGVSGEVAGIGTIFDDGTGPILDVDGSGNPQIDASGNPILDEEATKDDDRPITVTGGSFNEASSRAIFTIEANPNQLLSLDVRDQADASGNPTGDNESEDDGDGDSLNDAAIYYSIDGGLTWTLYDGTPFAAGEQPVLVAVDITNESDDVYEGEEQFQLVVNDGISTEKSAFASIFDDGTGDILDLDGSGNPQIDPSGDPILDEETTKDDDRPITVTGGAFNEASSRAIFTIEANPNQLLSLDVLDQADASGNPTGDDEAEAGGDGDRLTDAAIYYSIDGGLTWTLYDGTPFAAGEQPVLVAVDITNESDDVYEGEEQFQLIVNAGISTETSAFASIFDDGTGDIPDLDGSGNPQIDPSGDPILDEEAIKDDDRPITVTGGSFNEASSRAIFTVEATEGQLLSLDVLDEADASGNPTGDNESEDDVDGDNLTDAAIYYSIDGGSTWIEYDGTPFAAGDQPVLVAVDITNESDDVYEGEEQFKLVVNEGLSSKASAFASIFDDGTGDILDLDGSGNPQIDPSGDPILDEVTPKDDDRRITVTGGSYNEGSSRALFTIEATEGQLLSLDVLDEADASGNPTGADDDGADDSLENANLYYSIDGGSTWTLYTGTPFAAGDQPVLVAVDITNESDNVFEGEEQFKLVVNAGGVTEASAFASIIDDGTADLLAVDGSGNPVIDPSGDPILNTLTPKDDDRILDVKAFGPVNEASPYAMFSINAVAGLDLNLALGNTANLLDVDATISDFSFDYSTDGGANWIPYTWNGTTGNRPNVPEDGVVWVRVAIHSSDGPDPDSNDGEADDPFEGPETFELVATYATGGLRPGRAISTIIDNGTGLIIAVDPSGNTPIDASGNPPLDNETTKDDDRGGLSIPDVNVNEASPTVVFQISAKGGDSFTLQLSDGAIGFNQPDNDDGIDINQQRAVAGQDYVNSIEYYNGTAWVPYTGAVTVPDGGSVLLVRVPLINDDVYEGAHAFTLTATPVGAGPAASGRAIIGDFATGPIFNDSGSENRNAVKDDDRELKVDSPIVNEASDHVVFQVTGITGPIEQLSLINLGVGTGFASLTSPNLQYWTGSSWADYTGAPLTAGTDFPAGSQLYVRVAISDEQDNERELAEYFSLVVDSAGGPSTGTATIRDDGTGLIWLNDPSGNTLVDPSNNPILDPEQKKDDDFDKDGITPTTEDALSTLAASQGIAGNPGDLNGDGLADKDQNALATLAWKDVDSFTAGNEGTLTVIQPIISLIAYDDASGNTVSQATQLEEVRVVDYSNEAEFGTASDDVVVDTLTGVRTVSLGSGGSVTTPYDPIRFVLAPQENPDGTPGEALPDIFGEREGTQVRMFIDMRASGLDADQFNTYIKFVSQAALDASGSLFDLDGNEILTEGWYDFTWREGQPGGVNGDGARFVVDGNGKLTGIELILTDNAFGDNDMQDNRIFDPGVLGGLETELRLVPTKDGQGLELLGPAGESLWLDISAVLANAWLQNSYNLVRYTPIGGGNFSETAVGAIGATRESGFLGDTRVLLQVGEQLRFELKSNNLALDDTPNLTIEKVKDYLTISLDDSGLSANNTDFNDLVLKVTTSADNSKPRDTQMAAFQSSLEMAYLDLRWISTTNGTTLLVDVQTDSTSRDVIRLVRVDTDASGNPLGTVNGVAPTAGPTAFRNAVNSRLLSFTHSRSSAGTSNLSLSLTAAQAGVYAPVVITPSGAIYTFGTQSSTDGLQHVKTLGANSFGFEVQSGSTTDWDFNDLIATFKATETPSTPKIQIVDGTALKVTGSDPASGLWLDLNAILASTARQNNLDLIKVSTTNVRSLIGTVGATANTGFTGARSIFLQVGETLEFRQNSNQNLLVSNPRLRITQVGERFIVALDESMPNNTLGYDNDYNDLVLSVDSSITPPGETTQQMSSLQRSGVSGLLDLSAIRAAGGSVKLDVSTNSVNTNTLRFIELDQAPTIDPLTGAVRGIKYQGVTFSGSNRTTFLNTVRTSLTGPMSITGPVVTAGGVSTLEYTWDLSAEPTSGSGYYAPVLITPTNQVFTLGSTTASDGQLHLKVLGTNTFGFEELLASQSGVDWDFNDMIVRVSPL